MALGVVGSETEGGREPEPGDPTHQAAAMVGDPERVLELEGPGEVGRGDLAEAVADDRVGHDPPRPPERGEGDLQGQGHRLGHLGLAPASIGSSARNSRQQRPAGQRPEAGVALLHDGPEDGLALEEVASHARATSPLGRSRRRRVSRAVPCRAVPQESPRRAARRPRRAIGPRRPGDARDDCGGGSRCGRCLGARCRQVTTPAFRDTLWPASAAPRDCVRRAAAARALSPESAPGAGAGAGRG